MFLMAVKIQFRSFSCLNTDFLHCSFPFKLIFSQIGFLRTSDYGSMTLELASRTSHGFLSWIFLFMFLLRSRLCNFNQFCIRSNRKFVSLVCNFWNGGFWGKHMNDMLQWVNNVSFHLLTSFQTSQKFTQFSKNTT